MIQSSATSLRLSSRAFIGAEGPSLVIDAHASPRGQGRRSHGLALDSAIRLGE